MELEINLNEEIKVKLTNKGKELLIQNYMITTNEPCSEVKEYIEKHIDEEGYYHTQLWCFMDNLGGHIYMGNENLIEDNNIIIKSR